PGARGGPTKPTVSRLTGKCKPPYNSGQKEGAAGAPGNSAGLVDLPQPREILSWKCQLVVAHLHLEGGRSCHLGQLLLREVEDHPFDHAAAHRVPLEVRLR